MRISLRRPRIARTARLTLSALLLAGCTIVNPTGGIPRQPFDDLPVPESFLPTSSEWAVIRAKGVTAARLVYMTKEPVEPTAQELRKLLTGAGWTFDRVEPTERDGFKGQALLFSKRGDTCRAEIVPISATTRVDLIVGRVGE
jgi:hypothetical protein